MVMAHSRCTFTRGSKNEGNVTVQENLTSDTSALILLMDFICSKQKCSFAIGKTRAGEFPLGATHKEASWFNQVLVKPSSHVPQQLKQPFSSSQEGVWFDIMLNIKDDMFCQECLYNDGLAFCSDFLSVTEWLEMKLLLGQ